MGRIIDVHPGNDNKIRVVTIKINGKEIKRQIHKLAKLPIDE